MLKNSKRNNWKKISQKLKTKTPQQCSYRYNQILMKKNLKKFSRAEDILIIELIEKHGENWDAIAKNFPSRQKEEIIERYFYKLNHEAKKKLEFEPEEDALLLSLQSRLGNNWNEIAKRFTNKTVYILKNRFYSHLKKVKVKSSNNNSNSYKNPNENRGSNFVTNTENSGSKNNYNNNVYKNQYAHDTNSFSEENDWEGNDCCEDDDNLTISNDSHLCFSQNKNEAEKSKHNNNNINNNNININQLSFFSNRGFIVKNSNEENFSKNNEEFLHKHSSEKLNSTKLIKQQQQQINYNNFDDITDYLVSGPNDNKNNNNNNDDFQIAASNIKEINFNDFLKDLEKIDHVASEFLIFENFNKDFLNDSELINNYYNNSNLDYNSTSLLDLLEDENFSKDFLSRNSTKNSKDSLKYFSNNSSNESQNGFFRTVTNESRNSFTSLNSMNNNFKVFNFNSENVNSNTNKLNENSNNNNSDNTYNNTNYIESENLEKFKAADKIKNQILIDESKMLIYDSEMQSIPNNFYKTEEDYSRHSYKMSEVDAETRNNFNANYFKCFESEEAKKRSAISNTNSKEVIDKMKLDQNFILNKEASFNKNLNNYNNNKINKNNINCDNNFNNYNNIDCDNKKLNSETENDLNANENRRLKPNHRNEINRQLVKQYRMLQGVYKKYKQFKNLRIKIKGANETGSNILNVNLKKIFDEDRKLNSENDQLVKELINLRKEYKIFVAELKSNKKLKNVNNFESQKDPYFLRNSLLKQIEILMQLIKTLKMKVDLIRNFNEGHYSSKDNLTDKTISVS